MHPCIYSFFSIQPYHLLKSRSKPTRYLFLHYHFTPFIHNWQIGKKQFPLKIENYDHDSHLSQTFKGKYLLP